ncbi:hypothetical protein [Adhaeribacter aquaticus]|uniref:DUF6712 family protein n=1 Tax=Adhaeribacter aquaticus TaxID=299567 RepID=UPI00040164A3|nr:hypothetical protein [Adhaeribacter aquaticus]
MKITKADFPEFVDFTQNLEERKINNFITIAFDRDVKPKLTAIVLAKIQPDTLPDEDQALWERVRAYWVFAAYYRHCLIHGIAHTQSGFVVPVGEGYEQITDKRRAELMALVERDIYFYEGEMNKYITTNYLSQAIECGTPTKRKNRIGLWVVKHDAKPRTKPTIALPPSEGEVGELPDYTEPDYTL